MTTKKPSILTLPTSVHELRDSPEDDLRGEQASNDSSWGEGAASAFQTFKTMEQRRARSKPSEDHPCGISNDRSSSSINDPT